MMEAVGGKSANGSGEVPEKSSGYAETTIALVPFFEAEPPVFLRDSSGETFPARARSSENDFRLAVESLNIGHADEGVYEDEAGGSNSVKLGRGSNGQERAQRFQDEEDGCGNGFPGSCGSTKQKTAIQEQSKKVSRLPPGEHPLQKAITSFDMALGELNQLVHLIDLARAGEFVVLERVTPSEGDQARAFQDKTARPGDVPREALAAMVRLKKIQMKGAADQLRQRAKRMRETSKAQTAFQQSVIHLRKSWRIVAPNHGKVDMPLQVGEVLSVDCSFGSAGGRSVPSTAAAGTRHRHPWLFQLKCGGDGQLDAEPLKGQRLQALEVELMSATTGACEHVFRSRFPGVHSRCYGSNNLSGGLSRACYGVDRSENARTASIVQSERHIARLHHSVFWEEVFETIKAKALIDGKNGWLARQDARAEMDFRDPGRHSKGGKSVKEENVKGILVSVCPRDMPNEAANAAGTRVVHVMDDEVVVEMGNQYILGFKLVPDKARISEKGGPNIYLKSIQEETSTENSDTFGANASRLSSLCRLALLYCASFVRQQQQLSEGNVTRTKTNSGNDLQPVQSGGIVRKTTEGSTWKSVLRVLAHHVFRAEVVRKVAGVSRSLHQLGIPFAVRWTHLESTCATSALSFTLGQSFNFRASLDGGCEVIVSALPGLHNHADQRILELRSAEDLKLFLLGEGCRQIVLTFGDIAAAWTGGTQRCFRVDLVQPAIHLWGENPGELTSGRENPDIEIGDKARKGGCEVRVSPSEVGVEITCSRWASACGASSKTLAGGRNCKSKGWNPDLLDTARRPAPVTMNEWDRLEGRDIFVKFSSLLNILYPSRENSSYPV